MSLMFPDHKPSQQPKPATPQDRITLKAEQSALLASPAMSDVMHPDNKRVKARYMAINEQLAVPPPPAPLTVRLYSHDFDPRGQSDKHEAARKRAEIEKDPRYLDGGDPFHKVLVDEATRLMSIIHPEGEAA